MPDVGKWQDRLADELKIVVVSNGHIDLNRSKASEHGIKNVLVEKKRKIAETYHAFGTPTAVIVRPQGEIGSHPIGGADAIRQMIAHKAWTESGFATFQTAVSQPKPAQVPKSPLVGSRAPEFTIPDLDGKAFASVNFNGSGTVLLFWNPACGFCQKMLPEIKDWEAKKSVTAPQLILVSTGSIEANRSMGLESKILIDEKFTVGQMYGANGTPSGLLIDAHGKIASGLAIGAPALMQLFSDGSTSTVVSEALSG